MEMCSFEMTVPASRCGCEVMGTREVRAFIFGMTQGGQLLLRISHKHLWAMILTRRRPQLFRALLCSQDSVLWTVAW